MYHITGQPRFYIDNQWKLMGAFCWVAGNLGGQPQITMSYLPNCEPVEFISGFDFAETEYIVDEAFAEDITTDVSQHDESTDESESMPSKQNDRVSFEVEKTKPEEHIL